MASKRTKGDALLKWTNLPEGLVFVILDKLLELIYLVHFAVVCKEWHSVAKHYYHTTQRWRPNTTFPMLLIPHNNTTITKEILLRSSLYSIYERRIYINNLESPALPYGTKRLLLGCSRGWLATVDEHQTTIALVNPFRKSVVPILLPPLETKCRSGYLQKVILSADPVLDRNSCVIVAKFSWWLASMKLSDQEQHWTRITVHGPSDIIFHKSQLYLCYLNGSIRSWSIDDANNKFSAPFPDGPDQSKFTYLGESIHGSYLVESTTGDLWHVLRFRSQKQLEADSQSFKVFKVELIETGLGDLLMQQVEVNSIGDDALFIGYNSVSVLASQTSGCRPNSIFYRIECAMGMFNLDDETSSHIFWPYDSKPTFWVTPPFNSASLLCA